MALPATDNFNRANGGLGANWTNIQGTNGLLGIVSNQVALASGVSAFAYWNADTFADDHYSKYTKTSDNYPGILVRCSGTGDAGNAYLAKINSIVPKIDFFKVIAGTGIFISSATISNAGASCEFRAEGSTLSVYIDGVLEAQITDTDLATGSPGIYSSETGVFDDWEGGNLGSPPPTVVGAKIIFQHA